QMDLPADEGEARAQLQEDLLHVSDQPAFQVALVGLRVEGEEVEKVGILERLLSEVGLRRRQGGGEVGDGLALAGVQGRLDLQFQDGARPAVLHGGPRVPEALERVLNFGKKKVSDTMKGEVAWKKRGAARYKLP